MSNMATPTISQLPSDIKRRLRRKGDFFLCPDDIVCPKVAYIGENVYYRFMNFVYLPQPPDSLSIEKVVELCDLRLDLMGKLVNTDINKHIVAQAANVVKAHSAKPLSGLRVLDFGCGSGFSSLLLKEELPGIRITGVDISKKAVKHARKAGLTVERTYPDKALPFDNASFDYIFAIFVMHFNVGVSTLEELKRILHPSGKFVFNVYRRDVEGVLEQLDEVGFHIDEVMSVEGANGTTTNHVIVSCASFTPDFVS
ncbi:MAG TPA: class I SAM-dependent methyltransferase [Ktedonobacteraceae bacterium]|nr:class I SAM-dependent methyltransferase [Ktedonobacteraceae bacterium]